MEEDASSREYYAGLKERRERADSERLQLEHKLKLARLERAKQLAAAQVTAEPGSYLKSWCSMGLCLGSDMGWEGKGSGK